MYASLVLCRTLVAQSLLLVFSLFFVGVPIGFFSASLSELAGTIEDGSYSQNFANKLNWIDLSAEESLSMVNVVYDLPFFVHIVFSRY